MPPSKSGIADYSEALAAEMAKRACLSVFDTAGTAFDPSAHDVALYHIGNNPWHGFAYETALRHPGVVVMHEANLHHLIADLTIRRGDWDAYLAEAELNGGPDAREYAQRVRALQVGPDYDGIPMTRRLLEASRAAWWSTAISSPGKCARRVSKARSPPSRTGPGYRGRTATAPGGLSVSMSTPRSSAPSAISSPTSGSPNRFAPCAGS